MTPPIRPWAVDPLPWVTGTTAAAFDAWAIQERNVPQAALMERAGVAAARVVHHLHPQGAVCVLAGKGNNGGDALVAARSLAAWGREVRLVTADRPAPHPLLHDWPVSHRDAADLDDRGLELVLVGASVVVDGLLGTGISGAPRGAAGRIVEALRSCEAPVVALDVPSGVDADQGRVAGAAVRAAATVAFGWPKLGTLLHPGRAHTGRLLVVEIGFPPLRPEDRAGLLLTPAWAQGRWPRRDPVTHKNKVGALAVVAGRTGMAGAGILASRAALRSGAGYVRLVTDPGNREVVQSALPEAVFVDASDPGAVREALESSRAVAVGPGMGTDESAAHLLRQVLAVDRPRVVDADALTLLSEGSEAVPAGARTVLTPHPGEAARLLGDSVEGVEKDRVDATERLMDGTGVGVVVLKGAPTLVRSAAGMNVDTVATSDLAVAGMGDTLTGAIGAFLAQGCPPADAAGLGLVATGRAGARAARGVGLQSGDIPEALPGVFVEGPGHTDLSLPDLLLDLDPAR
ncbi:MAG: NAD(P)H-hydrate dehydratase [Gemmatimonadota bacterium]